MRCRASGGIRPDRIWRVTNEANPGPRNQLGTKPRGTSLHPQLAFESYGRRRWYALVGAIEPTAVLHYAPTVVVVKQHDAGGFALRTGRVSIKTFAQSSAHSTFETVNGSSGGPPNWRNAADFKTWAVTAEHNDVDVVVAMGAADGSECAASRETPVHAVTDAARTAAHIAACSITFIALPLLAL